MKGNTQREYNSLFIENFLINVSITNCDIYIDTDNDGFITKMSGDKFDGFKIHSNYAGFSRFISSYNISTYNMLEKIRVELREELSEKLNDFINLDYDSKKAPNFVTLHYSNDFIQEHTLINNVKNYLEYNNINVAFIENNIAGFPFYRGFCLEKDTVEFLDKNFDDFMKMKRTMEAL